MIAALPGRRAGPVTAGSVPGNRTTAKFARMADAADMSDLFAIDVVDIRGVPTKVFRNAPPSLRSVWDLSAAFAPNDYLVYGERRLTFGECHRDVRAVATWLRNEHVQQGDRVAIATRNRPEWVVAFWAVQAIGAIAVPLNAWWTGPELSYGLADSGSVVCFADDERAERIAPHLGETDVRATAVIASDRELARGVPWAEVVAHDDELLPEVSIDADADAAIMYTSGTTGRPKGAVQTQRNFTNFLMQGVYLAMTTAATNAATTPAPPMATLLTLPLFHVGGLQSFLLPFTAAGGKIVLMYRWDPGEAVDIVEREGITTIAGVPTTMFELLDAAKAKGASIESLAGISSGATLVPPELVRRIDEQTSSRAAPGNGYGLTETSGAAIANFGAAYVANPESVGKPISPVIDVRVVTEDGRDAAVGGVGEIWLKGPTVVRGYLGRERETAEAFTDGWFHTGDIGRLDAEGNLYVVDRMKDLIIRGGENIYAAEVEAALYEHPDITEAAIIGIPDTRLGETVGAVVRVRPGSTLTADGVREHVAQRLAAFKVPAHVWITSDELPRNASGKVLKRELRDKFASASQ
jgi:long-chain acyl-CoA synthetase